ncbi:MAG: DUF1445 domain-containing protein [Candidatus Methanomethyliaceae archaeon]
MSKTWTAEELNKMKPWEFREIVRRQEWTKETADACWGYGQANLIALPEEYAYDFLLLAQANPQPLPILEVTEPGDPHPKILAKDADLRTDLPKYRVFVEGKIIAEPTDAVRYWRDDLVAFLIGCSWGFVWAMKDAGVRYRSLGDYVTKIELQRAGKLRGYMVCSCRAFPSSWDAVRAIQISSRHRAFHGPPVHIGDPALIGVFNIGQPDAFVPPWPTPKPEPHEILMFWGCGITAQNVVVESKIPYAISHYPGHMFVFDKRVEELAAL